MGVKHIEVPKKPVAPVMPSASDFRHQPVGAFIDAYTYYLSAKQEYEKAVEIREQTKMIKLIKNADVKLILKKFKIEKR